jgi:hypothetical protein
MRSCQGTNTLGAQSVLFLLLAVNGLFLLRFVGVVVHRTEIKFRDWGSVARFAFHAESCPMNGFKLVKR